MTASVFHSVPFRRRILFPACALVFVSACHLPQPKSPGELDLNLVQLARRPLPSDQSGRLAEAAVSNWAYGQGLGDTAVKAGAAIAFPPYLLVLAGNAALS